MAEAARRSRTGTAAALETHPWTGISAAELPVLESIQKRVLWLSTQMVHHANSVRPNVDGLKVGGHQASSASIVSIFTALWFAYLRSGDRVAPKPHGSPAFHGIQYLLGNLDRSLLPRLRDFHGLQSYPSQTKDPGPVHFSLGSMGFGATVPAFAALLSKYSEAHFGAPGGRRFVSVVGDAELDEGSIWEAVAEEQIGTLGNVLWIVDLNRQSLDRVIPGIRAGQLQEMFRANNWHVLEAKYGRKLQAAFARPGGDALRRAIDEMSNQQYQALIRLDGGEIRDRLAHVPNGDAVARFLRPYADADLADLVGDLGGHDLGELTRKFAEAERHTTSPTVLFAYTVKGWGLPFAGEPMNHSAQLTQQQMDDLRVKLGIPADDLWAGFAPDTPEAELIQRAAGRLTEDEPDTRKLVPATAIPSTVNTRFQDRMSTQEAFGRVMTDLAPLAGVGDRILTMSADVAVSTNLGGWVNRVGVFHATSQEEVPLPGPRLLRWQPGPAGQHIELGISEMNLFTLLGQAGVSAELIGQHLLPIGTVYDPFICRGLDAIVHALYSGSKFIIVATPSGITLSPEGGAHQSTVTPGLGIELPGMRPYEPAFARELEWCLLEALRLCCDRENGLATYLRLSTKPVDQALIEPALRRLGEEQLRADVLAGGYRLVDWRDYAGDLDSADLVHIATVGTIVPEAIEAARRLRAEGVPTNVLNLTSAGRLFDEYAGSRRQVIRTGRGGADLGQLGRLIPPDERRAPIVTVLDGSSHALAFLGSAIGTRVVPLGVDAFGQSGSMPDLYREYGVDADHIVNAALLALEEAR
ncbi:MAG: pyruvate dehydrogenase [Chloroflexota bacterium]|nr:MAG: pyruvate dehydrogenase [Chloroflexota bacterium]